MSGRAVAVILGLSVPLTIPAVLAVLAVLAPHAAAATAPVPEVSLDMDGCPSVSRPEVARVSELELEARILDRGNAGRHTTRVQIACDGARAHLVVSDPLTGKQLLRTMDFTARDEALAARMLALALSELVLTSWLELTMRPVPEASAPPRPSAPPIDAGVAVATPAPVVTAGESDPLPDLALRRAAQERAEKRTSPASSAGSLYALALGQLTGPFVGTGAQWGGGIRAGWTARARWLDGSFASGHPTLQLDLGATSTTVGRSLGTVGVATISATPRLAYRLRRASSWLDLGAGFRLGLARLIGEPTDAGTTRGATLAGVWGGPAAYVGAGFQWRHLIAEVGFEAGRVLRPVSGTVGEGERIAIAGSWISAVVALGWGQ